MAALGHENARILVRSFTAQRTVGMERYGFGKLPENTRQRERFTQMSVFRVEGDNVVAHHHAQGQSDCTFVLILQSLGVEANIIEPPGVSFIKPIPERRIIKLLARDVSVVNYRFQVTFSESLRIILNQGR